MEVVYQTTDLIHAEEIAGLLRQHEIEVFISDIASNTVWGGLFRGLTPFRLMVAEDDAPLARQLIDDYLRGKEVKPLKE